MSGIVNGKKPGLDELKAKFRPLSKNINKLISVCIRVLEMGETNWRDELSGKTKNTLQETVTAIASSFMALWEAAISLRELRKQGATAEPILPSVLGVLRVMGNLSCYLDELSQYLDAIWPIEPLGRPPTREACSKIKFGCAQRWGSRC